MTTTHHLPRLRTTVAMLAMAALLASCGGKDAAADPPTSSGSSAAPDASESSTPSVEPATGELLDTDKASVRAPQGWTVTTLVKNQTVSALTENALSGVDLSVVSDFGADRSLAQLARIDLRTGGSRDGRIMPETEMAGLPAFHVQGMADVETTYDAYGLEHDGYTVTVIFKIRKSNKDRQEIIDSVLATVELK